MYSNLDKSNPGNKISLRHTDEMIECYVYNDFNWMAFTYSDIMSNKRRMRNFQVDDEMATEIIGPKAAFEKGIAKAFFKRPNSPELWKKDRGHREFVGGQFCWHKDENRGNAKNVWHELKKLLGKLSRDPKITGGKFHEYDTINVAHLLVFCNLIGFKIRVNDPEWNPASSDEWVLFLADLDNLMNGLETFSFIKGAFDMKFSRLRIMKFIGLSLGVRISNLVEIALLPSMYSDKTVFYRFPKSYESTEQVDETITVIDEIETKLIDKEMYFDYAWHEILDYYDKPDDLTDAKGIFFNCNPYNIDEIKAMTTDKSTEFFDYQTVENYFFVPSESLPDSVKTKLFVKPKCLNGIKNPNREDIEEKSGCPQYLVCDVMEKFEKYVIVDYEPLNFFMRIARNDHTVLDEVKHSFIKASLIKEKDDEQSILFYKTFLNLLNLGKLMKDYTTKVHRLGEKPLMELPDIKSFLSIASTSVPLDTPVLENLIMIAHGNISLNSNNFNNLSSRFQMPPFLIDALFISAQPNSIRKNPEDVKAIMKPLIKRRGFNVPDEIFFAFVDIYSGNFKGWLILAEHLCHHKGGSYEKVGKFIQLINWDNVKKISRKDAGDSALRVLTKEYVENIIDILQDFLEDIATGRTSLKEIYTPLSQAEKKAIAETDKKQILGSDTKIMAVFRLLDAIMKKDLKTVFAEVPQLTEFLGIKDEKTQLLFQAFTLLVNNTNVKIERPVIIKFVNVLFNTIFGMMEFEHPEDKENYRDIIFGIIQAIFAIIYWDRSMFLNSLTKIDKFFGSIMDLLDILQIVKDLKNQVNYKIFRAKNSPVKPVIKAMIAMIKMVISFSDKLIEFQKEVAALGKGAKAEAIEALDPLLKTKTFEGQKKFMKTITKILDNDLGIAEKIKKTEISIFIRDMKEGKIEYYGSLKEFTSDNPDIFTGSGQEFLAELLVMLIIGDFEFAMELLMEQIPKDGPIDLVVSAFIAINTLMNMSEEEFEEAITTLEPNYEDCLEKMTEFFTKVMDEITNKALMELENSGRRNSVQYNKLKSMIKFFHDNGSLFACFIKLLHAAKFGVITSGYMFNVVLRIIQDIGKSSNKELYGKFSMVLTALTGYDIEKFEHQKDPIEMVERTDMMMKGLGSIFFPELMSTKSLLNVLLELALTLQQASINQMDLNIIAKKYGQSLGSLFGVSPEIVNGIVGIMNGDFQALANMAAPIAKIDSGKMKQVTDLISAARQMMGKKSEKSSGPPIPQYKKEAWMELLKKVNNGEASMKELFELADAEGDGSGGISKDEFKSVTHHLSLNISDHRIDEIWAKVKKAKNKNQEDLDIKEFEMAMVYIQSRTSGSAMEMLGISTSQLIILLAGLLIILGLLFAFIFMGIEAFTEGGTFNSIINSMIPCISGGVLGQKKPVDVKSMGWTKKIEKVVEKVTDIILSSQ